jgi:hypothetical protein
MCHAWMGRREIDIKKGSAEALPFQDAARRIQ